MTLGIQGGTGCQQKLDAMRKGGVKVNGIWAQDWSGIRMTSFGKRNVELEVEQPTALYPQLDERIAQWKEEGVQFLSYINPCVASDKDLCEEASGAQLSDQRCRRHGITALSSASSTRALST